MSLFDAARRICESFTYDPGHSDLDNEQPIAIHCTLGDWRSLNLELMLARQGAQPEGGASVAVPRSLAERTEAMFRSVDPDGVIAQEWKRALSQPQISEGSK